MCVLRRGTYVDIGIKTIQHRRIRSAYSAVTAKQADVALWNRGKDNPVSGGSSAYLVLISNRSSNDASDITVDLSTSGVLKFGDQGIVAPAGQVTDSIVCQGLR